MQIPANKNADNTTIYFILIKKFVYNHLRKKVSVPITVTGKKIEYRKVSGYNSRSLNNDFRKLCGNVNI